MTQPNSVDVLPVTGASAVRQTSPLLGSSGLVSAARSAYPGPRRQLLKHWRSGFIKPGRRPRIGGVTRAERLVPQVHLVDSLLQRDLVQRLVDAEGEQAVTGPVVRIEQIAGQVDQLHRRER